jgi:hypothetical protein
MGEIASPSVCQRVADAMPTAPFKLQQSFATALSANRCGTLVLITALENGKASPAVLRDKATVDRLLASGADTEDARLRVARSASQREADKPTLRGAPSFDQRKPAWHAAARFTPAIAPSAIRSGPGAAWSACSSMALADAA